MSNYSKRCFQSSIIVARISVVTTDAIDRSLDSRDEEIARRNKSRGQVTRLRVGRSITAE